MYQNVLSKLKNKKVYSVEGNIGAGKSTLIKRIGKSFEDVEFVQEPLSNWENLNGESLLKNFYENPSRWGYSFESYAMYSKVEALVKAAQSDKPIIMVERSILANRVFFEISNSLGKLEKMEYAMLLTNYEFYTKNIYPKLAGIIYLRTPVEECVRRIKKRDRNGEQEVDRNYLATLEEKFDQFVKDCKIPTLNINGFYDLNEVRGEISEFMHKGTS